MNSKYCKTESKIVPKNLHKNSSKYFNPATIHLVVDLRYSRTFEACEATPGSSGQLCAKPGSTNIFSITPLLMMAAYLQERSPKPRSVVQLQLRPMARVKAQAPSGISLTFLKLPGLSGLVESVFSSSRPCVRPHCLITKASFTLKP